MTSALFAGFIATLVLTSLEAGAQQVHITRMSIPYLLGTMISAARERARVVGFLVHLVNGELFALLYVALFHALGHQGPWIGMLMGLSHAIFVLLVVTPLMPAMHPRMASPEAGPSEGRMIEPPGFLALNYGFSTPAIVVVAHAIFGFIIGWLYRG
jgi:hypothetical protein